MNEEYTPHWEDLNDRLLVVRDGDGTIRRHVYGAGVLKRDHPEIQAFLEPWQILEDAVFSHLPRELLG
jgi:hypothetical protein